jgi:hypothetical protein
MSQKKIYFYTFSATSLATSSSIERHRHKLLVQLTKKEVVSEAAIQLYRIDSNDFGTAAISLSSVGDRHNGSVSRFIEGLKARLIDYIKFRENK